MKKYSTILQNFLSNLCGTKVKAKRWLKKTRSNIYHLKTLEELSESELTNELELGGHIVTSL